MVMIMYKISIEAARTIREEMKSTKESNIYKKLQAVALRGEGLTNGEIAKVTGYNSNYVGELCKTYTIHGLEKLRTDGRKGGNNRNMSKEGASEFLKKYEEEAVNGQVITADAMAAAYDEAVGKKHKSLSTFYYLLHTHKWRLVTPKKQHPNKASDEEIAASKKLTLS